MSIITNHYTHNVGMQVQERINHLGIGQKMQDLPEHLWHESFRYYVKEDPSRQGGPNLRMIRLDPNKPSLTVTAFIFNKFVHPFENRFITTREAARLQGFPDNFEFIGSLTSIQRQIGNAVPVPLATAILQTILQHAKAHHPEKSLFSALSIFSGAGGLNLGAQQAKLPNAEWQTIASIDIDRDACTSLEHHFANKNVICQNIIDITQPKSLMSQPLDLLYGGPPCQSFSQAGKQKGLSDPRGNLIYEFIRFLSDLNPNYFLLENVKGLQGINNGKLLHLIIDDIRKLGYNVTFGVVNAADYGTPQLRKRIIILGCKQDLGFVNLPLPTHATEANLLLQPYKTVGQALQNLPPALVWQKTTTK